MIITDKLKRSQLKDLRQLYSDFFEEIDFNDVYSPKAIDNFAKKKVVDVKKKNLLQKFFFAIEDDKIVGFIHGKLRDDIGLISHAFVLKQYRNRGAFLMLSKKMLSWFKENNILIMEIEVGLDNPIRENIERHDWQVYQEFEDANVYHRKI